MQGVRKKWMSWNRRGKRWSKVNGKAEEHRNKGCMRMEKVKHSGLIKEEKFITQLLSRPLSRKSDAVP